MEARKRRKWDVAAPGGMPLTGNRAGIGSGGGNKTGLSGFITAQGLQASAPVLPATNIPPAAAAAAPPPQVKLEIKPGQPIDQATIARAQQGAQAIVERINAELRAKGQIPPGRGQAKFHDDSKEIAREVLINDAAPQIRYNLTKRSVQDDIQRRTDTIVVIKGRYQPPGTPSDDPEGPLRLRIMPGNVGPDDMIKQRAVIAGASEVRRILQGGNTARPAPPPSANSIPPPDRISGFVSGAAQTMQAPIHMQQSMPPQHGQFVPQAAPPQQPPEMAQTVPLYIAVEAPPHFDLHGRLRGPGDSYLQHISNTTGANVTLRGRGSGIYDSPDHLHLFVSASNPKSFEDAKGLCVNLIDTVRADYAKMFAQQPPPQPQPQMPPPSSMANGQINPPPSGGPGGYQQAPSSYPPTGGTGQPQSYAQAPSHQSSANPPSGPSHYSQTGQYQQASSQHNQAPYSSMPSSAPFPSHHNPSGDFRPPSEGQTNPPPPAGPSSAQGYSPSQQSGSPQGQVSPAHGQQGPFQGSSNAFQGQSDPQGAHRGPGAPPPQPGGHGMPSQQGPPHPAAQYNQPGQQPPYARPLAPDANVQGPQYQGPAYGQQAGTQQPPLPTSQQQHRQQQPPQQQQLPPQQQHRPGVYVPPGSQRPQGPQQWQGQGAPSRPGQGLSKHELAQQAERKRRFTEQKAETQWRQGATQQPSMPSLPQYGVPAPRPNAPPQTALPQPQSQRPQRPAPEAEAPPLPMGPPPPRSPVQFKMGSMGPPPPRLIRPPQGAHMQSRPPAQGLVPYGDDD